jgi:hypothetical protein
MILFDLAMEGDDGASACYCFEYFLDCDSMVIDLIYWLIGAI